MSSSTHHAAQTLLAGPPGQWEELQMYIFADDEQAHDDDLQEQVAEDFQRYFDEAVAELRQVYGEPARSGEGCEDEILATVPLAGVFRYAIWTVQRRSLILATAHEDRELPLVLTLGTSDDL